MKILIVIFFIYLFSIPTVRAQKLDTTYLNSRNEVYRANIKNRAIYKTTGWVLLGSGVVLVAGSYFSYVKNDFNGVWKQENLFYVGGVAAIASIPFFILAGESKRKAMLSLKAENIPTGKSRFRTNYPAVSFALKL